MIVAESKVTAVNEVLYPSADELLVTLRNPEEFEKYFKKHAFAEEFYKNEWKADGKKGYRLTLSDGSYIRIKFFDTVKKIFNSKNVEVPGRESFLSYIDVAVMPAGVKGYGFMCDMTQCVWAYAKGRRPAKELHAEAIRKLTNKASCIGIDLTAAGSFDDTFIKHFPK